MMACYALLLPIRNLPAQKTAATFSSGVRTVDHYTPEAILVDGVDGFEFIPRSDILITALGWYDHGGNGFLHDHPVGLYETDTQRLLSEVILDDDDELDEMTNFRYERLELPVVLSADRSYTVAGWSGLGPTYDVYLYPERWASDAVSIGSSSGLKFPQFAQRAGEAHAVWFGPNFRFEPYQSAISTVELLESGALRLEWISKIDGRYTVDFSTDLVTWSRWIDNLKSDGHVTALVDDRSDLSPQRFYRVREKLPLQAGFESGAEGWVSETSSGEVLWKLVTPARETPIAAVRTTQAMGIQLDGSQNAAVTASLRSPLVDLTTVQHDAILSFNYSINSLSFLGGGRLRLVSEQGGELYLHKERFLGESDGWAAFKLTLPEVVQNSRFRVEFLFQTSFDNHAVASWLIDNVVIR